MKSAHPDDAAVSGELVVLISGSSIELNALRLRLESAGAQVMPLPAEPALEPGASLGDLLVCDLASEGALAAVQRLWSATPEESQPLLVALGSPRGSLPGPLQELLARARQRFRRPLDISSVADELLRMTRGPRPSVRFSAPGELGAYGPLKGRSSRAPKPSATPAADVAPSSHPSSGPAILLAEDPAAPHSRQLSSPALEHSVISAELETLLAEAERRVQAQAVVQVEPVGSNLPNGASGRLSNDVWDALDEPLDEDAELPLPEASVQEVAPPSPLARDPERPSPLPQDSTVPPDLWDSAVDEGTGSSVAVPESEQTSGSLNPLTATGSSAAPSTLAPGPPHPGPARADELTARRIEIDESLTQTPEPRSTTPPAARARTLNTRPPLWHSGGRTSAASPAPARTEPRASDEERGTLSPSDEEDSPSEDGALGASPRLELPGALVRGAPALVIGRAVRQRFTGCLAFEVDQGLRRVVFKEGDVIIAASAVHGESLVSFLVQRGDLAADAAGQIEHRIPVYGRHAGAALIARGLLEQGELWPVLRAHAEWVLAQLLLIERGSVQIEHPVPERLAAEPAVFGGATGAEVLVEVIQRAVLPAQATVYLGSESATLVPGGAFGLLSECALSPRVTALVRRAAQVTSAELLAEAEDEPMLPCILHALCVLDVLKAEEPSVQPAPRASRLRQALVPDRLDDEALRAKVHARRALVDDGDYFALLGVPRRATGYDIRRSYMELRRQFDPGQVLRPNTLDLQDDVDTILEVLDEAYEILRDQQRRERYRRAIESTP